MKKQPRPAVATGGSPSSVPSAPEHDYNLSLAAKMNILGTFAGALAHDLNNILSGIVGYASYVKMKEPPDTKLYANLSQIEKSASRAVALTRKLILFSPSRAFTIAPMSINTLLDHQLAALSSQHLSNIRVETHLASELPAIVADPVQLAEAFQNLIENAVEAMGEQGGTLRIGSELLAIPDCELSQLARIKSSPCICVTIADTGRGFTDEVRKRLFEPFFSTRNPRKGGGLGLAVVYGIVAAHQGDITAEGREGKGAVFRVLLPIAD